MSLNRQKTAMHSILLHLTDLTSTPRWTIRAGRPWARAQAAALLVRHLPGVSLLIEQAS